MQKKKNKKWIEFEEPFIFDKEYRVPNEIDEMYGTKLQLKTREHRVVQCVYSCVSHFVNYGWAGSDDYLEISLNNILFIKKNSPVFTHYRIL